MKDFIQHLQETKEEQIDESAQSRAKGLTKKIMKSLSDLKKELKAYVKAGEDLDKYEFEGTEGMDIDIALEELIKINKVK